MAVRVLVRTQYACELVGFGYGEVGLGEVGLGGWVEVRWDQVRWNDVVRDSRGEVVWCVIVGIGLECACCVWECVGGLV